VLVDHTRAVDTYRLGDFAGRLNAVETGEIDQAVRLLLGVLRDRQPLGTEGPALD
jgi:mRNA-degrading endonuclease toxin of MazEF toxin-antitoxin module